MSGYTQYYPQKRSFTDREWKNIVDAFGFLYEKGTGENILDSFWDGPKAECISFQPSSIRHPFYLFKELKGKRHGSRFKLDFNFCKTERKPYDKYVTAILSIADYYAPGALEIKSDGYSVCQWCRTTSGSCHSMGKYTGQYNCWLPGILLATELCGITHMPKGLEIEKPEE